MMPDPNDSPIEWVKFGESNTLAVLGREVIFTGRGCNLLFLNMVSNEKSIYSADCTVNGDGVKCYAGHRLMNMFAFAENCIFPRILVKGYPFFRTWMDLEGGPQFGYTSLVFSDTEYLITLSGLPDFEIMVWNWRNGQKLTTKKSDIEFEQQVLLCSYGSTVSVLQMMEEGEILHLWDISSCGRLCPVRKTVIPKPKECTSPFVSAKWNTEGGLFIMDKSGIVYMMGQEKTLDVLLRPETSGTDPCCLTYIKGCLITSGPTKQVASWKKMGSQQISGWTEMWRTKISSPVIQFATLSSKDILMAWCSDGKLFLIDMKTKMFSEYCNFGKRTKFMAVIKPFGIHLVTLDEADVLWVWDLATGNKVKKFSVEKNCLIMKENNEYPIVALGFESGKVELHYFDKSGDHNQLGLFRLFDQPINMIEFGEYGRLLLAVNSDNGSFFLLQGTPFEKYTIVLYILRQQPVRDCLAYKIMSEYRMYFLIKTSIKENAGSEIYLYIYKPDEAPRRFIFYFNDMYVQLCSSRKGLDNQMYLVPLLSKTLHIIQLSKITNELNVKQKLLTGHQVSQFNLRTQKNLVLSYSMDGLVIVRSNNLTQCYEVRMVHHRADGGVEDCDAHPRSHYLVSLGHDKTLVCVKIKETAREACAAIEQEPTPSIGFSFEELPARSIIKFNIPEDTNQTYLEYLKDVLAEKERLQCQEEKTHLLEMFEKIKSYVQEMLTKNMYGPEEERLDIFEFNLDTRFRAIRQRETDALCDVIRNELEKSIIKNKAVFAWLKQTFWDPMLVPSTKLLAIFETFEVENYAMLPPDNSLITYIENLRIQREIEKYVAQNDSFEPWDPIAPHAIARTMERLPSICDEKPIVNLLDEAFEEEPEIDVDTDIAFSGSIAKEFIVLALGHYTQQQVRTYFQSEMERLFSLAEIKKLQEFFNVKFDEIYQMKSREMSAVMERNSRMRHMISEFNFFSTERVEKTLLDPEWQPLEIPTSVVNVEDKEVSVSRYISPSRQAILDAEAAEAERIRLLLLADDFRERALMVMMDGVLEVRWEDTLKIDIPEPKCMKEKDPKNFNEEDLRNIRDYNEKVQFLQSERERYKSILNSDFAKTTAQLKDGIKRFNNMVLELLVLKIRVESAIQQENLKNYRMCLYNHEMQMLEKKHITLMQEHEKMNEVIDAVQKEAASLTEGIEEARELVDSILQKDKQIDKMCKKDFFDLPTQIQESIAKLFKKRPKASFRNITSSSVLLELAKAVVGADYRPFLLSHDSQEFIKACQVLDQYVGVPNTIDEQAYANLCRHRRYKIENEIKLKAAQVELAEAENTIATYNKLITSKKDMQSAIMREINQIKVEKIEKAHNMQLQIVLKKGLVEVNLTGHFSDFSDVLMINRANVEDINKIILENGDRKLKAMMDTMNYRRKILVKEWVHKKMRMTIEDLQDQLQIITSIKVTKETQLILKLLARGEHSDKGMLSVEQEIESIKKFYERMIMDIQYLCDELDNRIKDVKKDNKVLDKKINDINVDICEQNLDRNLTFERKEYDNIKIRMVNVMRRARLVREIQKNHSEILVLQTELELLRLKTYPTLKFRTIP